MKTTLATALAAAALCTAALAWDDPPRPQPPGDISTGKYLYEKPDPSATGGIKGRITNPAGFIIGVYALSPNQVAKCWSATMKGDKRHDFEFLGLPMEKYDLVVLYKNSCYEGLTLTKDESTLTTKDRQMIKSKVEEGGGFFDQKIIFRLEGKTGGKGEKAMAIAAFVRNRESTDNAVGSIFTDHRRSIKVLYFMQVGPGWQVSRERELYVNFLAPKTGADIKGYYRPYLGGIRVTDSVKDLGELDLGKAK